MKLMTMFLSKNKMCSNCASFLPEWDRAGLCTELGVLSKRGEYIVDSVEIFDELGVDKLEHRHPVVRRKFGCIYWKRKK